MTNGANLNKQHIHPRPYAYVLERFHPNVGYVLEKYFVNHCDYYIIPQALPPNKLTILLHYIFSIQKSRLKLPSKNGMLAFLSNAISIKQSYETPSDLRKSLYRVKRRNDLPQRRIPVIIFTLPFNSLFSSASM